MFKQQFVDQHRTFMDFRLRNLAFKSDFVFIDKGSITALSKTNAVVSNLKMVGKVDLGASAGAEGWKGVLQLLREKNEKMDKLARALSVIQQGISPNIKSGFTSINYIIIPIILLLLYLSTNFSIFCK